MLTCRAARTTSALTCLPLLSDMNTESIQTQKVSAGGMVAPGDFSFDEEFTHLYIILPGEKHPEAILHFRLQQRWVENPFSPYYRPDAPEYSAKVEYRWAATDPETGEVIVADDATCQRWIEESKYSASIYEENPLRGIPLPPDHWTQRTVHLRTDHEWLTVSPPNIDRGNSDPTSPQP